MNIFISNPNIDTKFAKFLIEKLRKNHFTVFHSPNMSKEKVNWGNWYEKGLGEKLSQSEIFVVVIDCVWDSSSWMASESLEASRIIKPPNIYFWNPEGHKVTALGMIGFLKNELPKDLDQVVKVLKSKI